MDIDEEINWNIEEVWSECTLGRLETADTSASISPDGDEVHIYGVIYFDEQEQILSKMKELQGEVKSD